MTVKLHRIGHRQPRTHRPQREQRQPEPPELLIQLGDTEPMIRQRRRERVNSPMHLRRRVIQPTRRRRVEHRRTDRLQHPITSIERLAMHHPPTPRQREVETVRVPLDHRPVTDQRRIRARRQRLIQVAGVIDIIVGQEDPTHIGRLDQREHVLQPLTTIRRRAGVDDDRLRPPDHHRVDEHLQRLTTRVLHLMNHPRLISNLRRRHPDRRHNRRKRRRVGRRRRLSDAHGPPVWCRPRG